MGKAFWGGWFSSPLLTCFRPITELLFLNFLIFSLLSQAYSFYILYHLFVVKATLYFNVYFFLVFSVASSKTRRYIFLKLTNQAGQGYEL